MIPTSDVEGGGVEFSLVFHGGSRLGGIACAEPLPDVIPQLRRIVVVGDAVYQRVEGVGDGIVGYPFSIIGRVGGGGGGGGGTACFCFICVLIYVHIFASDDE